MNLQEQQTRADELTHSLDICVRLVPQIIQYVLDTVPDEHCRANVVAMLLVAATKTVLAESGFDEDKQVSFIDAAVRTIQFHPEVEAVGVVKVGGSGWEN